METRKAPTSADKFFRDATFDRAAIDIEARTVSLAFVSETPVERWFGREVLDCRAKSVRLDRLRDGAPLLLDHDPCCQIGVIESAQMDGDRVGRAVVRFSRSEDAEEIFKDVQDGIRRKVSVGYCIYKFEQDEESDERRATDWEPYEISIVSMPADTTVGVGRAAEPASVDTPARCMADTTTATPPAAPAAATPPPAPAVAVNDDAARAAREAELTRVREIAHLGERYNARNESDKAIRESQPLADFQRWILAEKAGMREIKPVSNGADTGLSEREVKRFDLGRAISLLANGKPLDGFEREASEASANKFGRALPANGIMLPAEVTRATAEIALKRLLEQRANHVAGTFTTGGALIQEEYGELIEYLRNGTSLGQLGMTMLSGIKGTLVLPVQTGSTTAYWVSETGAPTQSNATFGQKVMTPKTIAAYIDYSMQLFTQSSLSIDGIIRSDLQRTLAIAKDLAGIEGTGANGQPLGIKGSGTNATVTFSGAADWADVVEFETGIATDNAIIGPMAFLLSTATVGKWKTKLRDSVAGADYLIARDNTANGYPVVRTNQITGNIAFFGVFSQLIHAMWGGQEVVVDNITQATSRLVRVTISEMCDFLVRQPNAFNVSTDSAAQ